MAAKGTQRTLSVYSVCEIAANGTFGTKTAPNDKDAAQNTTKAPSDTRNLVSDGAFVI